MARYLVEMNGERLVFDVRCAEDPGEMHPGMVAVREMNDFSPAEDDYDGYAYYDCEQLGDDDDDEMCKTDVIILENHSTQIISDLAQGLYEEYSGENDDEDEEAE